MFSRGTFGSRVTMKAARAINANRADKVIDRCGTCSLWRVRDGDNSHAKSGCHFAHKLKHTANGRITLT